MGGIPMLSTALLVALGLAAAHAAPTSAGLRSANLTLDGSQAMALAGKTVQCIQHKDFACLEGLFDDSLTYQVAGYLPFNVPQKFGVPICNVGDKARFIAHIHEWQASYDTNFTYFGAPKFVVKSYDSVSFTSSVNWFLKQGTPVPHQPSLASEVTFFITTTPDGKKIKTWLEWANQAQDYAKPPFNMHPQKNFTAMIAAVNTADAGHKTKDADAVLGVLNADYEKTVYVDGASTGPTTYNKDQVAAAVHKGFSTQTGAVWDNQMVYAECGFVWGRYVYMRNSDTCADRHIVEGTFLHLMDDKFKYKTSLEFQKVIPPAVPCTKTCAAGEKACNSDGHNTCWWPECL